MPSPDVVRERAEGIRSSVAAAGGDPARVRLIAVTKVFGVEYVELAAAAGLTDIGENYAQELLAKHRALTIRTAAGGPGGPAQAEEGGGGAPPGKTTWHFVGGIQRNKISGLAPVVTWWHGVDRIEVGQAIASRAPDARLLVEVNVAGIEGRPGCQPAEVEPLVGALREVDARVQGLMTVAPPDDADAARRCFRRLAQLARDLELPELSMGMTDDFEIAVEEGATMVRIGRALFGPRPGTT
jgi:uncharacterized pyridoxal phosphate-containing UPF0001 family protein